MESSNHRDTIRLFAAAFLRAMGMGMTAVVLALYLATLGWNAASVGALIAASFAGAAVGTVYVSFLADHYGRRRTLVILASLETLGALTFAITGKGAWLFAAAFLGMINGMGKPRGASYALEQAILPELASSESRTMMLAWYGVILEIGVALGSFLSGAPHLLRVWRGWAPPASYHAAWFLIAAFDFLAIPAYLGISSRVEVEAGPQIAPPISAASKRKISMMAGLFAMDSFGGAMLTSPLLAYWFFRRFHAGEEWIGPLFALAAIANAISLPVAAWLAKKIGLLNTVVFTHLPSSVFLFLLPFAPGFGWAAALFLCRESLVQMDVPTRQSYLLAIIHKEERTFASGMTTLTRNLSRIVGSGVSGYAMQVLALSGPLFIGGAIKMVYDLALYYVFRRVKPPEENLGRESEAS
ncbi:MAG TPA: MFS transporter [Candidatus Acidoferrales bacterium]|nr:MFS transporter [Candidatus Acidoferrales bacterium]